MLRDFPASPARGVTCSPDVRAFTCSEASLPPLPQSCVGWSLLCGAFRPVLWSSWSLRAPSLCTNLIMTLRCCLEHLYPLLGHTLLLLSVLVQAALSTFPAPRPVAAREYPHREALWKVLCVSPRLLPAPPFCRGVLTARVSGELRCLLPSASHTRGTDFLSPSRCLCCCPDVELVLRPVDGELNVELGTVRVPLEISSQQLLGYELSP